MDEDARTTPTSEAEGITKPWCYHINQFEELRPIILDVIDYGERLGINPTYGDHEDSPGQLELNFLFDRAAPDGRQPLDLPPDLRRGRAQAHACARTATST